MFRPRYAACSILFCAALSAANEAKSFSHTPLAFEPNRGQWPADAAFGTHAKGFTAAFDNSGSVSYLLTAGERHAKVTSRWLGSSTTRGTAAMTALDALPGVVNYYVGNDESRWISALPTYQRLRAAAIYPGIDVVFYGDSQQLEYDLMVAPQADPGRISLSLTGGGAPRLNERGDLVIATEAGDFLQHKPVAYQTLAGKRTPVTADYVLDKQGTVRLALGKYDHRRALVIDPTIAWAQTLGSGTNGTGQANAVAVDASGNVYVGGTTSAADFPFINAVRSTLGGGCCNYSDAFVTKFNPDGTTVIYSTYFGGSQSDDGYGLGVDAAGNAILVGFTQSADMVTKNAYQVALHGSGNGFVAKFTPAGALVFATYLGGTSNADYATAVAADATGNIYVTGVASSTDFPVANAYQATKKSGTDGFLTKLSADGATLLFSTYIGGNGTDNPAAIALGPGNKIYIAGTTNSTDYPTVSAYQTTAGGSFITCFAVSGTSLVYSTLLGVASTQVTGIDVDAAGSAYVTGGTGVGLPTKNAYQPNVALALGTSYAPPDAFLTKLSADGASLIYSTYLGGTGNDLGTAVRVDASGNATVVGNTTSNDFPTLAALRPATSSGDGFITRFNSTGDALLFSTYIGGSYTDTVNALALDAAGNAYIAGATSSSDFPVSGARYYGTAFVAKLSGPIVSVPVTFNTVAAGLQLTVDGLTFTAPRTFLWAPGASHVIDVPSPQLLPGPNASNFLSWSNGGSKTQTVSTPAAATTFTATLDNQPCTYSFGPGVTAFGQAGTSSASLQLNTQSGCPWTATSNVTWISSFGNPISGSGTMYYSVSPNATGASRSGIITVGNATVTVTQGYMVPVVGYSTYYCCSSTSGLSQTFQYTVSDADGLADLTVSNMLISSALDGRQACYLAFDHVGNILYLVNDAGTALLPGMAFDGNGRASGAMSNSQCSVDGTKTTIGYSNQTTVNLGLTFAPGFGGNKVIYIAARDKEGLNTGWQPVGTWNVPVTTTYPNVVSAGTNGYSSSDLITMTATYQDATNNLNLTPSQILINTAVDGRNACYMGYDHKNNLLYLVDDKGANLLAGITPGVGNGTQQNSQCIIYAQNSSVQSNGKNYTLSVQVFFLPAFRGQKIVYGATQTSAGGNTGWQAMSALNIP